MKKVLTLSLALVMVAGVASADVIGVYSDAAGGSCYGTVVEGVPVTTYVVHNVYDPSVYNPSVGSQFKVQDNTGLVQLGSTVGAGFLAIGEVYTDLSVAYTACVYGNIMVVSLQHLATTAPGSCLELRVVAAPGKPYPITVNCNFVELSAWGGKFYFNRDGETCWCDFPVATEESTWGKVKSLYR